MSDPRSKEKGLYVVNIPEYTLTPNGVRDLASEFYGIAMETAGIMSGDNLPEDDVEVLIQFADLDHLSGFQQALICFTRP